LVGTFAEGGQATAVLSARVVIVVLAESRAIRGSWRTVAWASWMCVAALVEVNARHTAEQTEVVQILDFVVVVRGMTRRCLCVTCLVAEAH
jgi:hypothetical protein